MEAKEQAATRLDPKEQWAALSRREREVARLVAQGLTNREIGARLFVAERTAEGHVEQIRNKCGFHSRKQITRLVAELDGHARTYQAALARTTPAPASTGPQTDRHRRPRLGARSTALIAAIFLPILAIAGWFYTVAGPSRESLRSALQITTFAGTGTAFFSSDGLPPARTSLIGPAGLYVDPHGNVYVTDGDRVRQLIPGGTVTTIAGTGRVGFTGDGGRAIDAELGLEWGSTWGLMGLTIDSAGNLYIADEQNNRIRAVSPAGLISTFAGGGTGNPGDGALARNATLEAPRGLVMDPGGNLYVAETGANRVRRISPSGVITTIAGTGRPGFSGDGRPASSAQLFAPEGLALDASGNLYIADTDNNRIRKVDSHGIIATVAGDGQPGGSGDGGPAMKARLMFPRGLAVDSQGDLYIADTGNDAVRVLKTNGTISTIVGPTLAGRGISSGGLNAPVALAFDPAGKLYIADTSNNRILVLAVASTYLRLVIANDIGTTSPFDPAALFGVDDINLASNVFGGLYRYDAGLHVVPDIAQGPPDVTPDGLTYTFRLKPQARFSDGSPVRAADFVYSWSRAVAEQASVAPFDSVKGYDAVVAGRARTLSGLEAIDDHTLVASLVRPDAVWVDALAVPAAWVVNKQVIARYGENEWWTTPDGLVGTGPFRMAARVPNHSITFSPVNNWWGGSTGSLAGVRVDIVPNRSDQIAGYETGRYDSLRYRAGDPPPAQLDSTWIRAWSQAGHRSEVRINPYARTDWVGFNFASGPFADRVGGRDGRLAFSLAIDRQALAAAACDRDLLCRPATGGVVSKGLEGYLGDGSDPTARFDPGAARAALRRWDPDGSRVKGLIFGFDATPVNSRLAEELRSQWKANLGVDVRLQGLDRETFFLSREKGLFTLFLGSWQADYNHPQDWFDLLFRGGSELNWGAYDNPAVDRLVAVADRRPLRQALQQYKQAGRMLIDDVAYAGLTYSNRLTLVKPYIAGYGANALYDSPWMGITILKH